MFDPESGTDLDLTPITPATVDRTQLPTTKTFGREASTDKRIMVVSFAAAAESLAALTKNGAALQFDFTTEQHASFSDSAADGQKIKDKVRRQVRDALKRGLQGTDVNFRDFRTSYRFHLSKDESGVVQSKGTTVFVYRS